MLALWLWCTLPLFLSSTSFPFPLLPCKSSACTSAIVALVVQPSRVCILEHYHLLASRILPNHPKSVSVAGLTAGPVNHPRHPEALEPDHFTLSSSVSTVLRVYLKPLQSSRLYRHTLALCDCPETRSWTSSPRHGARIRLRKAYGTYSRRR